MELLSIRRSFYLINEMKALVKYKEQRLCFLLSAFCIGNDLCDQLSVVDGLSWIYHPTPELTFISAYGKIRCQHKLTRVQFNAGPRVQGISWHCFLFSLSEVD